ncbi:MAG: anti-sigma factor [Bacteriovoracia bacterium]
MNCGEWNRHFSDYLDGVLPEALQSETDAHLKTCQKCTSEMKQFRTLAEVLANKAPQSAHLTVAGPAVTAPKRWERAPWFIRSGVEGMGVAVMVLAVVLALPRLRGFYENNLEKRLSAFDMADIVSDQSVPNQKKSAAAPDGGDPLSAAIPPDCTSNSVECMIPLAATETPAVADAAETLEEEAPPEEEPTPEPVNITVGNSEIWRFEIKTESPQEIKPWLIQTLSEVAEATDPLTPNEVPGGIQFDVLIKKESVLRLKGLLETKVKPTPGTPVVAGVLKNSLTWFNKRAPQGVPTGKTRVVVWVSQI